MKITNYLLLIVLLFVFSVSSAQDKNEEHPQAPEDKKEEAAQEKKEAAPLLFGLEGKVTDYKTKKAIEGATVKLIPHGGISSEIKTGKKGKYLFETISDTEDRYIQPNTSFTIVVSKKGYKTAEAEETTVGLEKSRILELDFMLVKVSQ